MDISELKSGVKKKPEETPASGKNIDGNKIRDFGNGLKEFDPLANGFEPEKKELKPDDATSALMEFDAQMQRRIEEVEKYNELLDQYGGQITEEELREELGQGAITKQLNDGVGGKFEDHPGERVDASAILSDNDEREDTYSDNSSVSVDSMNSSASDYYDELEEELREDDEVYDDMSEIETKVEQQEVAPEKVVNISNKVTTTPIEEKPVVNETIQPKKEENTMSEEDKDLAALDDEYEAPTEDFDEKLKVELAKKLKPVTKKFDLNSAVVINKPVSVTNALNKVVPIDRRVFTWSLLRSKRPITMRSFTATELNSLNTYARNDARSRETFNAIWDHIVGNGKGKDFDTWAKCTSYFDVDHIWFCLYGACFKDANYLPYTCQNCNEVTVSTDIPVESMCKYDKPEVKEEMERIRKLPDDPKMGNVFAEYRVQVSNTIVVGFKEPSIYDAVIAPNMFDVDFRNKYSDVIGMCAYIANIYMLEETVQGLVLRPISVKQFIGNELKTAKARVIQYAKIIRSLSSDQYNIIIGHIGAINEEPTVSYGLPAISCDHCKKEIPDERTAAADLVFMRHRLAILGV